MSRLKRTTNYVDSSVQGSLLRRIFFHWLVFFGVTGLAIVALQTLLGDPSKTLVQRLQMEAGEFVFIGILMLGLLPAFMLDTVRFSNRFVGPILRLRRHLRELGEQETTDKCQFRSDDFWSELANEFNAVTQLVKSQNSEIESLKKQLEEARAVENSSV